MNVALTAVAALAMTAAAFQGSGGAPNKDSRGYVVTSNPAQVPPGANRAEVNTPPPNPAQVFAPRPSAGEYPPCTREVTDGCIQLHEKGVRRR